MITYDNIYPHSFYDSLIGRARAEEIRNFSDEEIHRVFDGTCAPTKCNAGFRNLISNGLTVTDIYPAKQPSLFEADR